MNCPDCDNPMYSYSRNGLFQKFTCMGKDCRLESITVEFREVKT